jgi:hypothetical protein
MADLTVELYGIPIGMLTGTWRTFDFLPDPAAVAQFVMGGRMVSAVTDDAAAERVVLRASACRWRSSAVPRTRLPGTGATVTGDGCCPRCAWP